MTPIHRVRRGRPSLAFPQSAKDGPWFLAGPFFNPAQVELCEAIEGHFAACGIELISPRKQHGEGPLPKIETNEQAWDVFEWDLDNLDKAVAVLMILDYKLPEHERLMLCRSHISNEVYSCTTGNGYMPQHYWAPVSNRPVRIPDFGTCVELGYCFGKKPIVGFTEGAMGSLNLMLSQGCTSYLYSLSHLRRFVHRPPNGDVRIDWSVPTPWSGGHI